MLLLGGVACRAASDRPLAESDRGPVVPPTLTASPSGLAMAFATVGDDVVGHSPGETKERLRVRRVAQPHTVERLCGVIAGEVRSPVRLDGAFGAPDDRPQLATKILRTDHVVGTRFLEPGDSARYRFEGLTVGDRRHVSFQWPITSDPGRPIPAGASDSVLEGAVMPTAAVLDAFIASLQWPDGRRLRQASAKDPLGAPSEFPLPIDADAVPLLSDLPVHQVSLEAPCLEATFAIPLLARVDEVVRVPVQAGDRVFASAQVADGTVRVSFDESPRTVDEPRQRQSLPRAAIQAVADGRVTVRIRAQVVPRAQATGQVVFLRLRRFPG